MMKKVLIGCAIATALVIVAGIGGTVFVVQKFKSAMPDSEANEAVEAALLDRDGPLSAYVPPLDAVPSRSAVEGYLHICRAMHAPLEENGDALTRFVIRMSEDTNPFRKAVDAVRGGVGLTSAIAFAAARMDSLLLDSGVSEGELAYMHALHRQGLLAKAPPELGNVTDDEEKQRKAEREARKMIDEMDSQLERGFRELLLRQQKAIEALEDPSPEQAAAHAWIREALDARSSFDFLREKGLMDRQRDAFAFAEMELGDLAPSSPGAYFLDAMVFGISDESDQGSWSINVD